MANNEFFVSSWAGCIGHTENGYPIRDYFIVEMVTPGKKRMFFQFHELYGVEVDGEWKKVQFDTERCVSSDDTVYCKLIWKFGDRVVPDEEIIKRYDIVDVTDLVYAVKKYAASTLGEKSPYVNAEAFLRLDGGGKTKLDGRSARYKAIVRAMHDYLKKGAYEKRL